MKIISLFLFSVLSFGQLNSQCDHPDYNALIAFYNSTNGDQWFTTVNGTDVWDQSCDPCDGSWFGVICQNENRVTSISLVGNNLTGTIPSEIGNLQNLERLSLFFNSLSGIIPIEIGNLQNLDELSISVNDLTGPIPAEIYRMQNLSKLFLASNNLTGSIKSEISNLQKLEILALGGNNLTGSIPVEISNLQNLTNLCLSNNLLIGSIPSEIGELQKLNFLALRNNNLTGSIPMEISNIKNLTNLLLAGNNFSGCIPESFIDLCYLTEEEIVECAWNYDEILGCQYDLRDNPQLPWQGDFQKFCDGGNQIGVPCDDNDPNTPNTVILDDCTCGERATNVKELSINYKIYPNPVQYNLHIEIDDTEFMVKIYDLLGSLMISSSNKMIIDTSNLEDGIYILELSDQKGRAVVKKFLKG